MVTGRLVWKPAILQETCNAVETQARHRSNGTQVVPSKSTTQVRRDVSTYTGGRFSCLCRHRRRLQRKKAAWGSLIFSHETTTEQHAPGCPATQAISEIDRSNKLALTYVGLRSLINSAIQLSFTIRSGAGGLSLGPNIAYYPIVDSESAPAFRMLFLLIRYRFQPKHGFTKGGLLDDRGWEEELVPSVVSSILSLFGAKRASP
jgi:hypothetical protein